MDRAPCGSGRLRRGRRSSRPGTRPAVYRDFLSSRESAWTPSGAESIPGVTVSALANKVSPEAQAPASGVAFGSAFGGSQSSMRLPSGSITHPKRP
jgi:hypothetical protein